MNAALLVSLALLGGIRSESPAPVLETKAAVALYVDASLGSDANGCTASGASACATIQAAIDKVPKKVYHPVTIDVAAGNYAGFYLNGFVVDGARAGVQATGAYIAVRGTWVAATGVSGTLSGTVTSATTGSAASTSWSTMTLTGAGWTTDQLQGKFVHIVTGTGSGQYRVIQSNSATVLTLPGSWTAPSASSTFEIIEPGSVINTLVTFPANYDIASTASISAILVANTFSATRPDEVTIENFKLSSTTASAVRVYNSQVKLRRMWFAPTTGAAYRLGGAGIGPATVTWEDSYYGASGVNTGLYSASGDVTSLTLTRDVVTASLGSFVNQSAISNSALYVGTSYFKNFSGGMTLVNASVGVARFTASIYDCVDNTSSNGFFTSNGHEALFSLAISSSSVSNCKTVVGAGARGVSVEAVSASGTGNATVYNATKGGRIKVDSASTMTGTTEISVDAVTETLTNMRANSPKTFPTSANIYGSLVFE
jgi:hypothetical protein